MNVNTVTGCLLGAAAGDALGRSVRRLTGEEIAGLFGPGGIASYYPDPLSGKALLSGDLQLTLFIANGVLYGEVLEHEGRGDRMQAVRTACMDWYVTQNRSFEAGSAMPRHSMLGGVSWLLDLPELYSRRAHSPAGIAGAEAAADGGREEHTCSACSSVVRVLPAALLPGGRTLEETAREGAEIAAMTLQGSASRMCAAFLSALVRLIGEGESLPVAIEGARRVCSEIYTIHPQWSDIDARIRAASGLAPCAGADSSYLPLLGEGWVPEEALAVALFCALRHRDDLPAGILAAANRTGDSCAAASGTGAMLGALLGAEGIPREWRKDLELEPVIAELAGDLSAGYREDAVWKRRYEDARATP